MNGKQFIDIPALVCTSSPQHIYDWVRPYIAYLRIAFWQAILRKIAKLSLPTDQRLCCPIFPRYRCSSIQSHFKIISSLYDV